MRVEWSSEKLTVLKIDPNLISLFPQQYGIQGFPTIKIFGYGKSPIDYQGAREAKPIVDYALQQVYISLPLHYLWCLDIFKYIKEHSI